jgi:hypothetical protein
MEQDYKFFFRVLALLTAVLITGISSCTISSLDRRDKWEKAVSNGADPMVTACALFEQTAAEQLTCNTLAQNRK